jgi:aspartate/methionine/tyrosine aminotransferase
MKISSRAGRIEPFYVMEVAKAASAMAREAVAHTDAPMIFLNIGEPDFTAPPLVQEAAEQVAIRDGAPSTPRPPGCPRCASASAAGMPRASAWTVPGQSHRGHGRGLGRAATGLPGADRAGDEVLMPDPSYPCNRHFVSAGRGGGGACCPPPPPSASSSAPTRSAAWGPRTRGVLLASPSNPTGTSIHPDELRRIHAVVRGHGRHHAGRRDLPRPELTTTPSATARWRWTTQSSASTASASTST